MIRIIPLPRTFHTLGDSSACEQKDMYTPAMHLPLEHLSLSQEPLLHSSYP